MTDKNASRFFNSNGGKPFVLVSLDEVVNPCAATRKALVDSCPAGRRELVEDYLTRTTTSAAGKPGVSAGFGNGL